ncbi:GNAT family N-acetyltransferase [Mesobacillus jeotgali]|uniref:GNAT family N-acetyltransferase n=1 Tax=Mesobacillus jeotgali TaxID=129985 RepID=UPI0009A5A518|nr:GNAT family N-acetyltransferase [Mesobacillus jeotgali]
MLNGSVIKLAENNDGQKVVHFLKRVAKWLKGNGINQWRFLLSGGDDDEILEAVKRNETYIVMDGDELVATFTLSGDQSEWDIHIFGEEAAHDSLYLHRFAIAPELIGRGLGRELLAWIEKSIYTEKSFLKLDCVSNNSKLNQFYLDYGFDYIGETDHHNKYQKKICR